MIKISDLNPKGFPETYEQTINMTKLCNRVNILLVCYYKTENFKVTVTSGLRSIEDHKRIYTEKAKKQGLKNIRIPMGSKHLSGEAVDISDPGFKLTDWCRENQDVLEQAGLWIEDDKSVHRIHIQCVAPASGSRFFKP